MTFVPRPSTATKNDLNKVVPVPILLHIPLVLYIVRPLDSGAQTCSERADVGAVFGRIYQDTHLIPLV